MKITAEFNSINSADLVAASIRKNISPFSDIKITNLNHNSEISFNRVTAAFGNGNPAIGPNMYTYPLPYTSLNSQGIDTEQEYNKVILEVICTAEDRKKVSSTIINGGGYEISEQN